jgi:hypothetical protein
MSLENNAETRCQRIVDRYLDGTILGATITLQGTDLATDPEAAADQVTENWFKAAESLIFSCVYFVAAWKAFENHPEKLEIFLSRLASRRMLSEDDIRTSWKTNGKVAMLRKIGGHADTLLRPSILRLLPAHYSVIYQICLLIEESGVDRAGIELSTLPEATRDDVIKVRAALKARDTESNRPLSSVDESAAQLFALHLGARDLRTFLNDYVQLDALDRCLRRPQPADNAGLVGIVPILMLGTFERTLMPLLGFGGIDKLFFESSLDHPEITDRDVVVVGKRGNVRMRPLTAFPADSDHHDVLTLAGMFFPESTVRCQLFAQARADGWLTFIGDENWNERPTVR